ncbi:hypothetical protein ACFL08_05100 [Patescibacteria group bacterium]
MKIFTILDNNVMPRALIESYDGQRYIAVGSGRTTGALLISDKFSNDIEVESGEIARGDNECFQLIPEENKNHEECIIVVKITASSSRGNDFKGDVVGSFNDDPVYDQFPGEIIRHGYSYVGSVKVTHIIATIPKDEIFTLSRDRFHEDVRFYSFDGEKIVAKKAELMQS